MAWWQFTLKCQAEEVEAIETLLQDLDSICVSLSDAANQPLYEPLPGENPIWQNAQICATFDGDRDPEVIRQQLQLGLPATVAPSLRQDQLAQQDWKEVYQQHFQPIQCAADFWIVPSWCEPPDPSATIVQLDPGMAFGTGGHATTALCLRWLANCGLEGKTVIDYGCGSGILAIAADKLKATRIQAVDIDPQAVSACCENMKRNAITSDHFEVGMVDEIELKPADLLIANILARPLMNLAPKFATLVSEGGQILLSGILDSQLEAIRLCYQDYFSLAPETSRAEWVCVSGRRLPQ